MSKDILSNSDDDVLGQYTDNGNPQTIIREYLDSSPADGLAEDEEACLGRGCVMVRLEGGGVKFEIEEGDRYIIPTLLCGSET